MAGLKELFLLNDSLVVSDIISDYQSLIWAERYADVGDFELVLPYISKYVQLILPMINDTTRKKYLYFQLLGSPTLMRAENINVTALSGSSERVIKLSGHAIEQIMAERVWINAKTDPGQNGWALTGTPQAIATQMYKTICVDGLISANDKLPLFVLGNPVGSLLPTASVTLNYKPADLLTNIKSICNLYGLGFRIQVSGSGSARAITFQIYTGVSRTPKYQQIEPIVLSEFLGNMVASSELYASENYRGVIVAMTANLATLVVDEPNAETGLSRRVRLATMQDTSVQQLEIGKARAAQKMEWGIDGTPDPNAIVYNRDYLLGDIITTTGPLGYKQDMMITEHITTIDEKGIIDYPTVSKLPSGLVYIP